MQKKKKENKFIVLKNCSGKVLTGTVSYNPSQLLWFKNYSGFVQGRVAQLLKLIFWARHSDAIFFFVEKLLKLVFLKNNGLKSKYRILCNYTLHA